MFIDSTSIINLKGNTGSETEFECGTPDNFLNDFNRAACIEEYKISLGDQKKLYDLHYKKVDIESWPNPLDDLKLLIITEPWCGDSTAIIPVLQKLFEDSNVKIRILRRDTNPGLMDRFLTNGGRAIPVVIILDEDGNYLGRFGPRPEKARQIFEDHREDIINGEIEKQEVTRKIRTFYAKDKGRAILSDFYQVINKIYAGKITS